MWEGGTWRGGRLIGVFRKKLLLAQVGRPGDPEEEQLKEVTRKRQIPKRCTTEPARVSKGKGLNPFLGVVNLGPFSGCPFFIYKK